MCPLVEGIGAGPHRSVWINSKAALVLVSVFLNCCFDCFPYWQAQQNEGKTILFLFNWLQDSRVFFKAITLRCPGLRCQRSISSAAFEILLPDLSAILDSLTLADSLPFELKDNMDTGSLMDLIDSDTEDADKHVAFDKCTFPCWPLYFFYMCVCMYMMNNNNNNIWWSVVTLAPNQSF